MSPVEAATREHDAGRSAPVPPHALLDLLQGPAWEIVGDWQMPADMERKS